MNYICSFFISFIVRSNITSGFSSKSHRYPSLCHLSSRHFLSPSLSSSASYNKKIFSFIIIQKLYTSEMPSSSATVGVDLGSSSLRAAYWCPDSDKAVRIKFGKNLEYDHLPNAVVFSTAYQSLVSSSSNNTSGNTTTNTTPPNKNKSNNDDDEDLPSPPQCLVGHDALEAVLSSNNDKFPPSNLVLHSTRLIGRRFNDHVVQKVINSNKLLCPCKIFPQQYSTSCCLSSKKTERTETNVKELPYAPCCIELQTTNSSSSTNLLRNLPCEIRPEEVIARLLIAVKYFADVQLVERGLTVDKMVIAIPSHFTSVQRQALLDAGNLASIQIVRILSSSMACAFSAFIHHGSYFNNETNAMFLHLGSNMLSAAFSCLEEEIADTRSTDGDSLIGTDDVDIRLMNYFLNEYAAAKYQKAKESKDADAVANFHLALNHQTLQEKLTFVQKWNMKKMCERCRIELATSEKTTLKFQFGNNNNDDEDDSLFELSLSRKKYEEVVEDLFFPIYYLLDDLFKIKPGLQAAPYPLDTILLSGLATQEPLVKREICKFARNKVLKFKNDNDEVLMKKISPENCRLDLDFSVCEGAAAQAGILTSSDHSRVLANMLMLDVIPTSLGIETSGGVMTKIIKKNSTVPSKFNQVFSTYTDSQAAVNVQVFEGDADETVGCQRVANFELTGIPPAPKGVPQIDVTFDVDSNGILNVSAYEKSTGRSSMICVSNKKKLGLSLEEKYYLIKNVNLFAAEFSKQDWYVKLKMDQISKIKSPFAAWKKVADAAFKKQEIERAIEYWTKASSCDPSNAIVHSNLSLAWMKQSNFANCKKNAELCIEKDGSWFKGYYRLGQYFEQMEQNKKKAMENYRKALDCLESGETPADERSRQELKAAIAKLSKDDLV